MARKILLADDSVTAQNMGRKILADAGYEVVTVNNGSAALKKIAESRPDLIVLDVYMPGYSGLEVCQRLKEAADTSRIPILLTVGKLEPFKPEEAKRVRAEGFIVKPFEASELLSALAKLEDKVVPRSDSSKPGRFARAIAAVEEGRYDNTVAIDEDSGWKSRISFPSKKKKAEKNVEPDEGDEAAIYNPVNKDLKTVVERTAAVTPPAPAENRVDLTALSPEGLPKDVTAEEIAALAAAAAQVQEAIASSQTEASAANAALQDTQKETPTAPEPVSIEQPASAEPKFEEKPQGSQTIEPVADVKEAAAEVATFAQQEPAREPANIEAEIRSSVAAAAAASADAPAAMSAIGSTLAEIPAAFSAPTVEAEPEPVTMAVSFGSTATLTRWTAVSVPLSSEEAGIVLQDEMLRMCPPLASGSQSPVEPLPNDAPVIAAAVEASPALEKAPDLETIAPLTVAEVPAETPPAEVASAPEPKAESPAIETNRPAVKNFETVTPAMIEPPAPSEDQQRSDAAAALAPAALSVVEVSSGIEASVAEVPETPAEPATSQLAEASASESASAPSESLEPASGMPELQVRESEVPAEPQFSVVTPASMEEPSAAVAEESKTAMEVAASAETPTATEADRTPTPQLVEEIAEPAPSAKSIPGEIADMAKKESDIAASTAAAWASWRRIRESGDSRTTASSTPEKEVTPTEEPKEEAAMAVAAGAEKAPEEVSETGKVSPEIASIVDSVLADLRPKIVEEISRKLGKKK